MRAELELWLQRATRKLSKESAARVRVEIQEHYDSARETAIENGASPDEAGRVALSSLGDAQIANKQYRRVLLTVSEAKMLGRSNKGPWIVSTSSDRPGQCWAISLVFILFALVLFRIRWANFGYPLLAMGLGAGFQALTLQLPVYTPSRARVFRYIWWIVQSALWLLYCVPFHLSDPGAAGVASTAVGYFAWTEWQRAAIRRKLPVADWPRHLYL